ncbi:CLUMA_CG014936, isoform A [Clunio marinus]|uniref:CLUMA_CG014936, isoform A n=1 Tax=Clunio marinus TaxID=568069 RepID=A0A1J1INI2_9DIPT|nr:CLUMA_CG014936, isoform A [Clunio marinus]
MPHSLMYNADNIEKAYFLCPGILFTLLKDMQQNVSHFKRSLYAIIKMQFTKTSLRYSRH